MSCENMTLPKERNKFTVTDLKDMESYKSAGKELKIVVLRKISKLQKNPDSSVKPGKHFMNKISSTKR